ncbi:unnamed protein product, partial [Phaeothamnion confervicola]
MMADRPPESSKILIKRADEVAEALESIAPPLGNRQFLSLAILYLRQATASNASAWKEIGINYVRDEVLRRFEGGKQPPGAAWLAYVVHGLLSGKTVARTQIVADFGLAIAEAEDGAGSMVLDACLQGSSQLEINDLGCLAAQLLTGLLDEALGAEQGSQRGFRSRVRLCCDLSAAVLEQSCGGAPWAALCDVAVRILSPKEGREADGRPTYLRDAFVSTVLEALYGTGSPSSAQAADLEATAALEAVWTTVLALAGDHDTLPTALAALCLLEAPATAGLSPPPPLRAPLWRTIWLALSRPEDVCRRRAVFLVQRALEWTAATAAASAGAAGGARWGGMIARTRLAQWERYIQVLETLDNESHNNLIEQVFPALKEFCAGVCTPGVGIVGDPDNDKTGGCGNGSGSSSSGSAVPLPHSPRRERYEQQRWPPSLEAFGWSGILLSRAFAQTAQGPRRRAVMSVLSGELSFGDVAALDHGWVAATVFPGFEEVAATGHGAAARDGAANVAAAWLRRYAAAIGPARHRALVRLACEALQKMRAQAAMLAVVNGLWLEPVPI